MSDLQNAVLVVPRGGLIFLDDYSADEETDLVDVAVNQMVAWGKIKILNFLGETKGYKYKHYNSDKVLPGPEAVVCEVL